MELSHIKESLLSQHLASLQMLEDAVRACPEEVWSDDKPVNPYWRIAYHALFFYRLYLHQELGDHKHWSGHRSGAHNMPRDPDSREVAPYTKEDILAFVDHCREFTMAQLTVLDIEAEDSGFPWYSVSKFEHLMVNVRHLQHHIGQLQDRMRNSADVGIRWTKSV
ncbi:MAG: DinB family protein [Saprospiraceae bacterium]|nr:DinB family protein [Saprospiraceae bacterium]